MSFKLSELAVGENAILDTYHVSALHQKMLSMGLAPGQKIAVLRRIPLNGNLYVRIENRHLAFRHEEATKITVKY